VFNIVLTSFLLKAFVSCVNRSIAIRMVKFCRSTKDVLIWSGPGVALLGYYLHANLLVLSRMSRLQCFFPKTFP
jgi:hypothetical protein